ncbi:hypothetical protein CsSME_00052338 [Camellia sinensis var. sinensis]
MPFGGQHPGGMGVPAVGMAFPGYVAQPQLGLGNSEMTWLPVLAGAAGALGATYCSPYITVDGAYHSRPSGQASSSGASRLAANWFLDKESSKKTTKRQNNYKIPSCCQQNIYITFEWMIDEMVSSSYFLKSFSLLLSYSWKHIKSESLECFLGSLHESCNSVVSDSAFPRKKRVRIAFLWREKRDSINDRIVKGRERERERNLVLPSICYMDSLV